MKGILRDATLCFLVRDGKVLLGMKKRGFGEGKWNGFGGKVNDHEKIEEAAMRELHEECSVQPKSVEKVGELTFIFPYVKGWNQLVHVFICSEWSGEPKETEEMRPEWFGTGSLPFGSMWKDDPHWLPLVLAGKKVDAMFVFGRDNESIIDKTVLSGIRSMPG